MSISENRWFKLFNWKTMWPFMAIIFPTLILSSYLGYLVPQYLTLLGQSYGNVESFKEVSFTLLWIFFGIYFTRTIYQLSINKFVQVVLRDVRDYCYSQWILSFDLSRRKKEDYPLGEVLARMIGDTDAFKELATSGSFALLIDFFFIVACLIGFLAINTVTGFALGLAEVVAAILLIWGSKYMRKVFHRVRKARGLVSAVVANLVGGTRDSYFLGHDDYATKRSKHYIDDFFKLQIKANFWDASYYSLAESLYPLLLILVVVVFPYSQIAHAAVIFALVDLIQRSIKPIKDMASKVANIQRAWTGLHRINEFLDDLDLGVNPLEHDEDVCVELDSLEVSIDQFSYGRRDEEETRESFALKNIQIRGEKGDLLGIVGHSGSGKSTLLKIISGNLMVEQGKISLHGRCENRPLLLSYPGEGWRDIFMYRKQVGIVSQDSHLFSETLGFNLSLSSEVTDELRAFWIEVKRQIPYLEVWGIELDTKISIAELSLGQKQLIAGVRACFLNKQVVLFDEISSALDSELEEALRSLVLFIQKNSLTIIVAHRMETIANADRIYVVDEGRIDSCGKHSDLMEMSHKYREFVAELSSGQ